jgi:hypothetical protein
VEKEQRATIAIASTQKNHKRLMYDKLVVVQPFNMKSESGPPKKIIFFRQKKKLRQIFPHFFDSQKYTLAASFAFFPHLVRNENDHLLSDPANDNKSNNNGVAQERQPPHFMTASC